MALHRPVVSTARSSVDAGEARWRARCGGMPGDMARGCGVMRGRRGAARNRVRERVERHHARGREGAMEATSTMNARKGREVGPAKWSPRGGHPESTHVVPTDTFHVKHGIARRLVASVDHRACVGQQGPAAPARRESRQPERWGGSKGIPDRPSAHGRGQPGSPRLRWPSLLWSVAITPGWSATVGHLAVTSRLELPSYIARPLRSHHGWRPGCHGERWRAGASGVRTRSVGP